MEKSNLEELKKQFSHFDWDKILGVKSEKK